MRSVFAERKEERMTEVSLTAPLTPNSVVRPVVSRFSRGELPWPLQGREDFTVRSVILTDEGWMVTLKEARCWTFGSGTTYPEFPVDLFNPIKVAPLQLSGRPGLGRYSMSASVWN